MIVFLSSSSFISNLLTIVSGLIILKWLLPSELGFFNTFTVIAGYITLAHIGVPVALNRDLPYFMGKGEKKEALKLASVAKYWSFYVSIIISFLGVLVALFYIVSEQRYDYAVGVLVIIFQTWNGIYVAKYLRILYRTNRDFNKLSLINLVVAIFSFLSIYFVYKFGFYGLCLRAIIIVLISFSLLWYWRPIKVKMIWDYGIFKGMLKIGFPMFLVNNVYGKWELIQRTLILVLLGTNALGLFTIVFVINNAFKIFSNSINTVLFPTLMMQWGNNKTIGHIFLQNMVKPLTLVTAVLLIISPLLWYVLPITVNYFLPKYAEIISAGQWMIIAGVFGILNMLSIFYNVINSQKQRLFMFLSGEIFWFLIIFVAFFFKKLTFELFPQALIISYIIMAVISVIYLKKNWYTTQDNFKN